MSSDQSSGFGDNGELLMFSDHELEEKIRRQEKNVEIVAPKLPDRGVKLKEFLRRLEEERERRRVNGREKVTDESKKPTQSQNSTIVDPFDGPGPEGRSPNDHPQSSFCKEFSKRIDKNSNCRKDDRELAESNNNDCLKKRSNGHLLPKSRKKCRSTPRKRSAQSSISVSLNGNRDFTGSSPYSLRRHRENKRNAFLVPLADVARTSEDQAVVLDDEEDCESETIESKEHAEKPAECMKETKIYYPSRDDPDPVIISRADMECLAPETYLTSTIMNFYIRYLQQHAALTNRVILDYLFFNTYFYEKLKEAVTYKGADKNAKFMKFRRWWKGVNIFHKAYVLIPIHQDQHWSLVIICLPDKDDDSGPIILHLDSLGFHSSRSIFDNIKSYMKEEWNCLNQEVGNTNLPIVDNNTWKLLPRRIEEKKITVPRQRNDYDCGLFVLFFTERFIVDAPERLVKRKDLSSMFGRDWFKPKEASGLRRKIRSILEEEFKIADRANQTASASPESENGSSNNELVTDAE